MKKVLFVVLPYLIEVQHLSTEKLKRFKSFPYGVLSLATYLTRNSDTVIRIFDCNLHTDYIKDLHEFFLIENPDIVAISMMFDNSYPHLKEITDVIHDANNLVPVVLGGAATVPSYVEIMDEQPGVDAICYSEGEIPFLELVKADNMWDVINRHPSWITRESLSHGITPLRTLIVNLDEVVAIDYSFVNIDDYPMREAFSPYIRDVKNQKQFFVVTSRGCCFDCTFCMNSANPDKTIRYASVDAVIAHVRDLVENHGMTVLSFFDDQILYNKKRAKELYSRLAEFNLRIECPNGLSVAFIDDELAKLMRAAGQDTTFIAIESGSEYVLKDLMHKPVNLSQVKPVVEILHKYGFWVASYVVNGMPGETDVHRAETTKFMKESGVDWIMINSAAPVTGSLLWKQCIEKGYIPKNIPIDQRVFTKYIINQPHQTPEYLIKESYKMNLDVNFVNNHSLKVGDYVTAVNAFKGVIALHPGHAFAYYYLGKALIGLLQFDDATYAFMEFDRIIHEDSEWYYWADHFKMVLR